MLPETALAPESLLVDAAGSAVGLNVALRVRDAVLVVDVLLSGLSNKMCGEKPVGSDESESLVSVDEVDSSSSSSSSSTVEVDCAFFGAVVVVGA